MCFASVWNLFLNEVFFFFLEAPRRVPDTGRWTCSTNVEDLIPGS